MKIRHSQLLAIGFIVMVFLFLPLYLESQEYDPVTMDPQEYDKKFPPIMLEAPKELMSDGKRLNGIIYLAQGQGPHPTVLLLHGLPGNERNLDLAQVLRRAGWNVVFFHYRGAWGSEGHFSFTNCVEDVGNVLRILREPRMLKKLRIDAERIVLIGHSLGGATAILAAAKDPKISMVISIAGANVYTSAKQAMKNKGMAQQFESYVKNLLPLNVDPRGFATGVPEEDLDDINPEKYLSALSAKSLLFISGSRDTVVPAKTQIEPLVNALKEQNAKDLTYEVIESDHSFSDKRIALARTILSWLNERCKK
ncbi:alpha/beta hydrolase family protein [Acidobacteriota bacterium]